MRQSKRGSGNNDSLNRPELRNPGGDVPAETDSENNDRVAEPAGNIHRGIGSVSELLRPDTAEIGCSPSFERMPWQPWHYDVVTTVVDCCRELAKLTR